MERKISLKKRYLPLLASLYTNFIFQGMATIIIAVNMTTFTTRWSASVMEVTLVISAIGLGRIVSLSLAGYFSDVAGRKKTVLVGTLAYILFFVGMVLSTNYISAFITAMFAGIGNAFLDTSTYPVVLEAFPSENDSSSLSVLNKAFISIGQFFLPLMTRFILMNQLYYGLTFLFSAVCLVVNFIVITQLKFPQNNAAKKVETDKKQLFSSGTLVEGLALCIFSFVSVSLFNVFILWIPSFAEFSAQISKNNSLIFVSIYSVCSFISVFLTSAIVKKGVNIPSFIAVCVGITGLSLLYMIIQPNLPSIIIASVCVGFFSAGGIWQLGLSVLLEFFPSRKGIITSYYSLATALSVMGSPYLTGILAEKSIHLVFVYVIILSVVGCFAITLVNSRYRKLMVIQNEIS